MEEKSSYMTVDELAEYLKLHPLTVRKLARDGQIPAFKVGRRWHVKRDAFEKWIEHESLENLKPGERPAQ